MYSITSSVLAYTTVLYYSFIIHNNLFEIWRTEIVEFQANNLWYAYNKKWSTVLQTASAMNACTMCWHGHCRYLWHFISPTPTGNENCKSIPPRVTSLTLSNVSFVTVERQQSAKVWRFSWLYILLARDGMVLHWQHHANISVPCVLRMHCRVYLAAISLLPYIKYRMRTVWLCILCFALCVHVYRSKLQKALIKGVDAISIPVSRNTDWYVSTTESVVAFSVHTVSWIIAV